MPKIKLKKGDKVKIITGKDKGKEGNILKVIPSDNKAIVSGINLVKKHMKATKESEGGIISKELPIHISNLSLLDPSSLLSTKVGYRFIEDGKKVRVAKVSGKVIEDKK